MGGDTRGASGWIIFVALAAIAIMALFILLRIAGRGSTIIMAVVSSVWIRLASYPSPCRPGLRPDFIAAVMHGRLLECN